MKNVRLIKRCTQNDLEYLISRLNLGKLFNAVVLALWMVSLFSCQATKSKSDITSKNASSQGSVTYKRTILPEGQKEVWYLMDPVLDSIPGISIEKARTLLKNKESSPLVTAIIDSGIDVDHEVLKEYIWNNKDEIGGNNKDDDGNGYVDDTSGWNFLGEIHYAPMAITRLVAKWKEEFSSEEGSDMGANENAELERYQQVKEIYDRELQEIEDILQKNAAAYTDDAPQQFREYYEYQKARKDYHYNLSFNPRVALGDDISDLSDKQYGNNSVKPVDDSENHGTHVAGVFTAVVGKVPGAAITFMPIRNTPNGDEYDKDVALAIRYAVDNGAKVINMSFGKNFSMYPEMVYEAIEYAGSKDVLIVHAAGNNGQNVDTTMVYPNDHRGLEQEIADNFINVGAINRYYNETLIPTFTNYGAQNVDVFAPGHNIYSSVPGNKYEYQRGTSMAAPMVSAVAALIRSYYPGLNAPEVKQIIMKSGLPGPEIIWLEGKDEVFREIHFKELCKSGRILNAYYALQMADKITQNEKNQNLKTNSKNEESN